MLSGWQPAPQWGYNTPMTNFDERAKDWDSDPMKADRARSVANAIRAAVDIRPGMSALEYGCGTGLLSFFLKEDFASITLADTSQGMLDVLSDKIRATGTANMHPVRLDLAVDPLPVQKFDVIYSLMVLHHIHDTDVILRKFHQLLEPGGWLVVADLDKEDGSFHTDGSTDVHLGFAREELKMRVEAVGFGDVRFSTAYQIKKMIEDEQKVFPIFLMTARPHALT
jgi:ubiquinone/menaquinone biosynthesis C-methylase UbiE